MKYSGKLELTWVNKEKEINVEPRILVEDKTKSYGDPNTENMLIHGDNLIALKALERDFAGKIKCVYIDPPYNTGAAFEHYDDNVEHSIWLSLMQKRLQLLHTLLSDDGSIWISIDDDEGHYLKVLCDEIFGRQNFVSTVIWEKKFSPQNDAKWLSDCHDFILVYAKSKENWRPNLLPRTDEMNSRYKNPDNDPRGPWTSGDCLRKDVQASGLYEITTPSGRICTPPSGRSWRFSKDTFEKLIAENRIYFGPDGNNVPRVKRFLSDVKQGITAMTIWKCDEVGHNQEATQEVRAFNNTDPFETPKPERLLQKILTLASNEGDFVLDSFLGSGTTAAVSQKMKRKWIGVELMDTAYTHCKKRLDLVIEGKDNGGITKSVNWNGGGGYKFYELAEPLLVKNPIIPVFEVNPSYSFEMVCEAICKIEAFTYAPADFYHGYSTENRFIHVTLEYVNGEYVADLASKLSEKQSLIIYCLKHQRDIALPDNIEIRRIPKDIQEKCNFESE
jgi:adenine-specific DNA-methyltransferase